MELAVFSIFIPISIPVLGSIRVIVITNSWIDAGRHIYPVGRLDAESTGLLLLTSNGDCLNSLLRAEGGKQKVRNSSICA